MTKSQLEKCFKFGKKIIQDISPKETNIMGFGEMGIINYFFGNNDNEFIA